MHTHEITSTTRHLTASMVVFDFNTAAVLLVHHNATDLWLFPGGHIDPNETPGEAALREVLEETGVRATITAPPVVLPGMIWHPSPWLTAEIPAPAKPARPGKPAEPRHWHIDQLFLGGADSRAATTVAVDEIAGVRWVPIGEISTLDVRAEVPQVTQAAWHHLTNTRPYVEGEWTKRNCDGCGREVAARSMTARVLCTTCDPSDLPLQPSGDNAPYAPEVRDA